MKKSLSHDACVLQHILKYQIKMNTVLRKSNCKTRTDLLSNEYLLDLCSFYISNIGELSKGLTDSTKESLSYIHCSSLVSIRNKIDHAYTTTNRDVFIPFIFLLQDKVSINLVRNRITYCYNNKRC